MSCIKCGFDATHLYRVPARAIFKKRIILMNAIPPPEMALHLSIVAWVAAFSLLFTGFMLMKKRGVSYILMCLYRFFIREAAF